MAGGSCEATAFGVYGYRAAGLCLPLANYHNMGNLDEVEAGSGKATPLPEVIALGDFHALVDLLLLSAHAVDGEGDLKPTARSALRRCPAPPGAETVTVRPDAREGARTGVEHRIERDSMGEVEVPSDAYYGASTQRAVDNFPISGLRFGRRFIWALGLLKGSAATVSTQLGHLDAERGAAIRKAADEVMEGSLDEHFVLDIFQTGSGTSTNTNANEVIAARAD